MLVDKAKCTMMASQIFSQKEPLLLIFAPFTCSERLLWCCRSSVQGNGAWDRGSLSGKAVGLRAGGLTGDAGFTDAGETGGAVSGG